MWFPLSSTECFSIFLAFRFGFIADNFTDLIQSHSSHQPQQQHADVYRAQKALMNQL